MQRRRPLTVQIEPEIGHIPRLVDQLWPPQPPAAPERPVRYQAFVPDGIAASDPAVTFDTAAALRRAEDAILALNAGREVAGLEAIGALLLRSEAVASSRIEGYELSQHDLARALVDPRAARGAARTVAANVVAMEAAVEFAASGSPITREDILEIHRILMAHEGSRVSPGHFRQEQNWLGGRLSSPADARYVPPPAEEVTPLMDDLVAYLARDDVPPVAQAAIAHAQFETIHPFLDGNGRVGRCLIHVVLRARGVAPRFVPPVSLVLAARPDAYVQGLIDFREGRIDRWCASFAGACERASVLSSRFAEAIARRQERWYEQAGRPRRDSAAARIISVLPAQPIASAATIRAAIGSSHQRALDGLKLLADAKVVRQISAGGYDRQYAADELFAMLEDYEREVATGTPG